MLISAVVLCTNKIVPNFTSNTQSLDSIFEFLTAKFAQNGLKYAISHSEMAIFKV